MSKELDRILEESNRSFTQKLKDIEARINRLSEAPSASSESAATSEERNTKLEKLLLKRGLDYVRMPGEPVNPWLPEQEGDSVATRIQMQRAIIDHDPLLADQLIAEVTPMPASIRQVEGNPFDHLSNTRQEQIEQFERLRPGQSLLWKEEARLAIQDRAQASLDAELDAEIADAATAAMRTDFERESNAWKSHHGDLIGFVPRLQKGPLPLPERLAEKLQRQGIITRSFMQSHNPVTFKEVEDSLASFRAKRDATEKERRANKAVRTASGVE